MRFWYPAAISQITEINDSFDSCMLRVCYAGKNRNKSVITKEAIEKATPTMAYCPLVANYDVDADTIGGHDIEFIKTEDGDLKMVNLTDAVGVVPENPQWTWETVTEDDGTEREYLCTPAILWKRTPVYDKLKREGVSGQSMEIKVLDGRLVDGLFEVDSFCFTAFCLLGDDVEPCFESAQVEMFSIDMLADRFSQMMADFKNQFSVIAASADDYTTPNGGDSYTKGGENSLDINELLEKYGLTMDDIDFSTDDMSFDEIDAKLAEIAKKFGEDDPEDEEEDEGEETPAEDDNEDAPGGTPKQNFQLTAEQMTEGIHQALCSVKYTDDWGEWCRYGYVDYDPQAQEVYAFDNTDWNLYGFAFNLNGDQVVIDFDSKKRMRIAFVEFDMGNEAFSYKEMFDSMNDRFAAVENEVKTLREFKSSADKAERQGKLDELFAKFEDLAEDAAFIALRENCADMAIEDIEDKCFAIRGRRVQMKFSQENAKPIRLPVEHGRKNADEPYNGVFLEYGIGR